MGNNIFSCTEDTSLPKSNILQNSGKINEPNQQYNLPVGQQLPRKLGQLGAGAFGAVELEFHYGQQIAIKSIKQSSEQNKEEFKVAKQKVIQEINVMRSIKNENLVIKYITSPDDDKGLLTIKMEYGLCEYKDIIDLRL